MTDNFDLSTVFEAVTKTLQENQTSLDAADGYNGNHGTHMVQTFQTIQKAVQAKSSKSASEQLAYASKQLAASTTSGSGKLYAEGLQEAAEAFKGKEFNQKSVGTLVNALMGSSSSSTGGSGDFLTTLLSGMSGNSGSKPQAQQPAPDQPADLVGSLLGNLTQQAQPSQSSGSGDLLSTLLGGLGGSQAQPSQSSGNGDLLSTLLGGLTNSQGSGQSGLDAKDLLSAALAYFSAKQSGQSNLQAILQAVSAASRFSGSNDRTQSGALVVNTILNMMGSN